MNMPGSQDEAGSPLHFAPPTAADLSILRQCIPDSCRGSDCSVANIFLLRGKYNTTIARRDGWLFRHFEQNERLNGYAFPCGQGNPADALELLRRDAEARKRPLQFCLLTAQQLEFLRDFAPGQFHFECDRGNADYLYDRTQLASLPGARFHAKRNHIAQFEASFPAWKFRPLDDASAADALSVAEGWLRQFQDPSPTLFREMSALQEALRSIRELELFGGVLYVQDAPIGMSVGSLITPQVADIHFEKCLPDFRRAYPLLNRETARLLPESCLLVNREEDLNEPGLRKAKLSYHPNLILEKWSAFPCPHEDTRP